MYLDKKVTINEMNNDPVLNVLAVFPEETKNRAEYLEVWLSSMREKGDDFTLFKLFDSDGKLIDEIKVAGY